MGALRPLAGSAEMLVGGVHCVGPGELGEAQETAPLAKFAWNTEFAAAAAATALPACEGSKRYPHCPVLGLAIPQPAAAPIEPTLPAPNPPVKLGRKGGLRANVSAALVVATWPNMPQPAFTKVFGCGCHARAKRGCQISRGTELQSRLCAWNAEFGAVFK